MAMQYAGKRTIFGCLTPFEPRFGLGLTSWRSVQWEWFVKCVRRINEEYIRHEATW